MTIKCVTLKGWRWMPGMLGVEVTPSGSRTGRIARFNAAGQWVLQSGPTERWHALDHWLPDLEDPATLGCLLALVREAWDDAEIYCQRYEDANFNGWIVRGPKRDYALATGDSEVEALLTALETAPVNEMNPARQ